MIKGLDNFKEALSIAIMLTIETSIPIDLPDGSSIYYSKPIVNGSMLKIEVSGGYVQDATIVKNK